MNLSQQWARAKDLGPKGVLHAVGKRLGMGGEDLVHRSIFGHDVLVDEAVWGDTGDYDTAWVCHLIKQCSSFYDVGCNIGRFALVSSVEHPGRKVVCVDANANCLAMAAAGLIRNGFAVEGRYALGFVSDAPGEVLDFYTDDIFQAGSRYADNVPSAKGRSIKVSTITIDGLVDEFGIVPDLVKLDVEGAEAEALRGATRLALEHKPRWIVEMHGMQQRSMAENARLVLEWCGEVGYDAWYLFDHTLLTDPAHIADRGRCHLLLQPAGAPYPEGLDAIRQGDPADV